MTSLTCSKKILISLPRSGTHWFKLMLAELINQPVYEQRLLLPLNLDTALRSFSRSHLCYDHLDWDQHSEIILKNGAELRIILLVRNPLDALVSTFYYLGKMGWLPNSLLTVEENLRLYIRGHWHKPGSNPSVVFKEHWLGRMTMRQYFERCMANWAKLSSVCIVRYEDLVRETQSEMEKVLNFLSTSASRVDLNEVIENNKFFNLAGGRAPGIEDRSSHYRKGVSGDGKRFFSTQEIKLIDSQIGDLRKMMGYYD